MPNRFAQRTFAAVTPSVLLSAVLLTSAAVPVHAQTQDLATATIGDQQAAMAKGKLTSEKLTQLYLARIAAYGQTGPNINSVIPVSPISSYPPA